MVNFWRITPGIALTTALALLLAGLGLGFYNEHEYRVGKIAEADAEARILAATVTAALTFDDQQAAQEYVSALQANPDVLVGAVYDKSGALFTGFVRSREDKAPTTTRLAEPSFNGDRLAVTVPITQGQTTLGTVYLQTVTEPLARRLERYAVIALLVIMASTVVGVLGIAQATLSNANAKLDEANRELRAEMAQREQAEDALRQAQKMEAIGQLTGGVAHDFNNLLQVMLASLDAVHRRLERGGIITADDLRRPVQAAIRGAERAASLTQRLLAFARRQPLAPQSLDVNKLVSSMSDMLHRTLGAGIEIEAVLAAGLWRVSADVNQLESSLLNLAVNARDAMAGSGKLTVETANTFLDETYAAAHEEVQVGQYVVVAVADNGVGMPPETARKAFDPFFTTKDVGQGTGLGLSQVYGFVKQSGGHVKIYSELGQGTTVKIYLPRLVTANTQADQKLATAEPPRGSKDEVVLVVEDEADVRAFTVDMLRELGYGVVEAEDGRAALRLLEATPSVRLLFTDVGLPGGLNGRQLAEAARRIRPDLRVLYTTGYARNAIVHHGKLDPGVELIAKPFTYAALATKVRSLFDGTPASGQPSEI